MARVRSNSSTAPAKMERAGITPEARESQLITYAINLAEKQLKEGTASSQVITHFLKLGTTKAELEREKLKNENLLLEAKADSIRSDKESRVAYEEVLKAMKTYGGYGEPEDYDDID